MLLMKNRTFERALKFHIRPFHLSQSSVDREAMASCLLASHAPLSRDLCSSTHYKLPTLLPSCNDYINPYNLVNIANVFHTQNDSMPLKHFGALLLIKTLTSPEIPKSTRPYDCRDQDVRHRLLRLLPPLRLSPRLHSRAFRTPGSPEDP